MPYNVKFNNAAECDLNYFELIVINRKYVRGRDYTPLNGFGLEWKQFHGTYSEFGGTEEDAEAPATASVSRVRSIPSACCCCESPAAVRVRTTPNVGDWLALVVREPPGDGIAPGTNGATRPVCVANVIGSVCNS